MKTICVTSFHSIISRNLLQTGLLGTLKSVDVRIVLLVPKEKEDYFKTSYGSEVDEIVGVSFGRKQGDDLLRLLSISAISVENLYVRRLRDDKQYGKLMIAYLSHIFGYLSLYKRFLRFLDHRFMTMDEAKAVLSDIKPDMFFSTDIYHGFDKEFIKAAQSLFLPNIGMVRSWDNVTTKGVLMGVPDSVIVHNEILRDELKQYNNVSPKNVTVVGIPHYDVYGQSASVSREIFSRDLGLDPQKKIILFSPGGKILYQDDLLLLKIFKDLLDRGELGEAQILVRIPPSDDIDKGEFIDDKRFVFDVPAQSPTKERKLSELSSEDETHLINTLYHSDILVTLASTIVIDAAAFDLPTVIIGFNPPRARDKIEKFSRYTHFSKLLKLRLVPVVKSEAQFVDQLKTYLSNKSIDSDDRRQLIECYTNGNNHNATQKLSGILIDKLNQL